MKTALSILLFIFALAAGATAATIVVDNTVDPGDDFCGLPGCTLRELRGIGPSLGDFGNDPLADPMLELHDVNGVVIVSNDNCRSTQEAAIEDTGLAPNDDLESAILATLAAGNYTAILRGVDDTTGVGLVEAYHLD